MVKMVNLKFDYEIELKISGSRVSVAIINFLAIDHGSNSRVSWSVPYHRLQTKYKVGYGGHNK